VNKYGGIYCDVDFKPLQPLSVYELENYDMLLHHGGNEDLTVSNSLFGFSANNELSNYIVESITKDRIGGYYPRNNSQGHPPAHHPFPENQNPTPPPICGLPHPQRQNMSLTH